jgi:serine/threonine-protein phosphatase 2A regulatory subunit B''
MALSVEQLKSARSRVQDFLLRDRQRRAAENDTRVDAEKMEKDTDIEFSRIISDVRMETPTVAHSFHASAVHKKLSMAALGLEIDLRSLEVEKENDTNRKVVSLLSNDNKREEISLAEYLHARRELDEWLDARKTNDTCDSAPLAHRSPVENAKKRVLHNRVDVAVEDLLYTPTATPSLSMCHYIYAIRNAEGKLPVRLLLDKYSRQHALLKSETEMMMYDANNDGRLTEEELDDYVRGIIPTIRTLHDKLQEDSLPFYCCAVNRRIMWNLDKTARGFIKISDLMQSTIMEEWLEVQLSTEEVPRNWFSFTISSQLYDKFLALDKRECGMLTLDDMKAYKKGIPMVVDDGLPPGVSPLSALFVERVFETMSLFKSEMDYKNFVDFVVAVEFLPSCPRPQFFWNILDIREEGVLTPVMMNAFFRETHQKLVSAGVEAPPVEMVVQEVFDIVPSQEPLRITREEFISATQAGLFAAVLVDCLAFWTYENREQR